MQGEKSEINRNGDWHWWSWLTRVTLTVLSSCCAPSLPPVWPSWCQSWVGDKGASVGQEKTTTYLLLERKYSSSFYCLLKPKVSNWIRGQWLIIIVWLCANVFIMPGMLHILCNYNFKNYFWEIVWHGSPKSKREASRGWIDSFNTEKTREKKGVHLLMSRLYPDTTTPWRNLWENMSYNNIVFPSGINKELLNWFWIWITLNEMLCS